MEHVLANLAAGETVEGLLDAYPQLEPGDIRACFKAASRAVRIAGARALAAEEGALAEDAGASAGGLSP